MSEGRVEKTVRLIDCKVIAKKKGPNFTSKSLDEAKLISFYLTNLQASPHEVHSKLASPRLINHKQRCLPYL